jgi:glycosidase
MKSIVTKWQRMMLDNGGWNALYASRITTSHAPSSPTSPLTNPNIARYPARTMLATLFTLQSGTPYIYQGQEIDQINVPCGWGLERYRDIETLNHWQKTLAEHPEDEEFQKMTFEQHRLKGRDDARTPMRWSERRNAGFTTAEKPWIDVHPDYEEWNVESQAKDPDSVLNYWRAVLRLTELKDMFVRGDFEMLDPEG